MAGDQHTYGFNKRDAEQLITKLGTGETETPERRRRGSGAVSGTKIVQTPGGGIAARSGTTVSSASCTEFKIASGTLTTNTSTITVHNVWPFAIPGSMYILASRESISSEWIAVHPGVINVRWVDPDLEQTLNGSTYTNIDTAEDCS